MKIQAQKNKPVKVKQKPATKAPGKVQLKEHEKRGKNKRIPLRVTLRAEAATGKVKVEEKPKCLDIVLKGIFCYCFLRKS